MNNKLLLEYSEAIMSIPAVRCMDQLMGIWFDIYVDLWLKMYYAPSFMAGKEDEWSQTFKSMLTGSNLCKP